MSVFTPCHPNDPQDAWQATEWRKAPWLESVCTTGIALRNTSKNKNKKTSGKARNWRLVNLSRNRPEVNVKAADAPLGPGSNQPTIQRHRLDRTSSPSHTHKRTHTLTHKHLDLFGKFVLWSTPKDKWQICQLKVKKIRLQRGELRSAQRKSPRQPQIQASSFTSA